MTNEMRNVPELRFPEFDGEWEEKKLGDIADFTKGKLLGKKDLIDEGKYPCILYGELYTKYGSIINDVVSRTNVNKDKLKKGSKNQILIPSSGETIEDIATASTLNTNKDVYIGGDLNILTPKEQDGKFISLSLNGINKWNMAKLAQGKTVVHLYNNDIKTLNINLPHKMQEQQKIGEFFSKLDRQIELEEQKLEKLKEQKKGYMQKIFSQELRFKDESGKDYPEWEIKKLGELYKIVMGQSPKSINYTDDNSYPVLVQGNADIYNGNIFPRIYTKEITKLVKKGDILLTVRAPVGEIGIAQFEACMGRGVCSIEGDKFIYYFLEMFGIQNKWQKLSQGSTFESISGNEVRNIEMPIPSPREREKVSDFFSELDHIINMHSQKIDNMKLRKQGLLQKMFI
ncbi:restriction endonuclease subunit S [Staphylococcus simulans]